MKIRRFLSLALSAALLLAPAVPAAWAASDPDTLVFDVSGGPVTVTGGTAVQVSYGAGQVKSDIAPGVLITLITSTPTANTVTVSGGTAASPINIALNGVNIDVSATAEACAFNMAGAAVKLFLKGESVLKSGENKAGLNCPSGATLVVADGTADGKGKLTANGGNHGAGIGSGFNGGAAGNITINSGTLEAHGNGGGTGSGAGIGGGHNGGGGTIIINGGTITANGSYGCLGGYGGAGIGAGNGGHGCSITINGGTINATGQGAGIGSGYTGTAGTVTINGGTVKAVSRLGAGIGGSYGGNGGTVTITGGTVTAWTDWDGAGIGGGRNGHGGVITITGGTVTATGGPSGGSGIGGGLGGTSGTVRISNGKVTATCRSGSGAGIGSGGISVSGNDVVISGGMVTVQGGPSGVGIGNLNGGSVTISGGSVNVTGGISAPKNSGGSNVYLTQVTLDGAGEASVDSYAISADGVPYAYGTAGVKTDANGKLYLYLPADASTTLVRTADGAMPPAIHAYVGAITTTNDHKAVGTLLLIDDPSTTFDLVVTSGSPGGYTYFGGALSFTSPGDYTVRMRAGVTTTGDRIRVTGGTTDAPVNITLEGVNIDASSAANACAFETASGAVAKLLLEGETTLKGGANKAGLYCSGGTALTIADGPGEGTGKLTATGGNNGAGIGGSVAIGGCTVIATGTGSGAGIGGGTVTIDSGTVKASGGSGGGAGIGGTTTINGGTVTANGGSNGAGIGGPVTINDGTVTANGGGNGAGIGGGNYNGGGTIIINGGTVTANGGSNGAGIGGGSGGSGGSITINGGTVKATGGSSADYGGAGIGGGYANSCGTVTINNGTVTAFGGKNSPGIGGGSNISNSGTVTIKGGIVQACGGNEDGAGIGGGIYGAGGNIVISGGTVTAIGSNGGAGIGGGHYGDGGNITISGGTVTATGGKYGGAGIGGGAGLGSRYGGGGTVVISGGTVKANGAGGGANIGGGAYSPHNGTLKNGSDADVFLTTATLYGAADKTALDSLVISLAGGDYSYGTKDVKTDANGKLYLYLPAGASTTAARTTDGADPPAITTYAGSITTTNNHAAAGTLCIRIAAPTNLAWDTTIPGKATWSAVENAVSYDVQLYKDGTASGDPICAASGTEHDFTSDIAATGTGSYIFKVTAIANGTTYSDSEQSAASPAYAYIAPRIATPANLAWDTATPGKATWDAVENAVSYDVQLYKDGTASGDPIGAASGTEHDFTSDIAATGTGSYTFKVTAVANGTTYSDSGQSAASPAYAYIAPRIATPINLAWDGTAPGKATWSAVENAVSYDVQLYKDGTESGDPICAASGTEHDFTSDIAATGTGSYIFKVTAIANGTTYSDSEQSAASPAYAYIAPRIATPINLAWDGTTRGKATWGAVENAVSYDVQLYKDGTASGDPIGVTSGTEHDFTSDIAATGTGGYTFKVTAVANGTTYSDSGQSAASPAYAYIAPRIATPANLAWDTTIPGKATWDAVENAVSYDVQLYKDGTASGDPICAASGTEHDFTSDIAATGTGSYIFKVTAIANGTTYSDSEQSAASPAYAYIAPRIATPINLAWDGTTRGKATWGAVENAVSYDVQLYKDGTASGDPIGVTSGTEHDFTSDIAATGTGGYTFKVTAVANGTTYSDSGQSAASPAYAYIAPRIATPANLAWDTTIPGKATWDAVENAVSYDVQLYKDGTASGDPICAASGTEHDFTSDIAATGTGSYTFRVTAIANGTTYSDSGQSAASPAYAYIAPRIATPINLAWDGTTRGKATWGAVENAVSYDVQLYKDGTASGDPVGVTSGTEHDFTSDIAATGTGGYTFKVTAVANGTTYSDSGQSAASPAYAYIAPRIATPANLAWDTTSPGKATWDAVENAVSYDVQLYKDGTASGDPVGVTSGTEHDFTSDIAATGTGGYTFKVTAVANGTTYSDSGQSAASPAYAYIAYTITALAGSGGSISPSGAVTLGKGENQTFTIMANEGYAISSVVVDGVNVGAVGAYAFYSVAADHTIRATFRYVEPDYLPRTLTDPATGVIVSGAIHEGAQLAVKPLALHPEGACAACDAIRKAQRDKRLTLGLDISLSQGFIAPLTVSIPVGNQHNGRPVTILHCIGGKLEEHVVTVVNGKAVFAVTSLSPFAAVRGLWGSQVPEPPRTGDSATAAGFIMLGLMALWIGRLIVVKNAGHKTALRQ